MEVREEVRGGGYTAKVGEESGKTREWRGKGDLGNEGQQS